MKQVGRVVAIANQKGGVAKTTTAVNLGASLALEGQKVLVVDVDPQGNATSGLGINRWQLGRCLYDALVGDARAEELIVPTEITGLDVLPATMDLAGIEVELIAVEGRERRLREVLRSVQGRYDYVFLDCPPSLGLLTINALVAADGVIIPVQCEYYALEGLGQLMHTIQLVQRHLNRELVIDGVLLTMFDGRTNLSIQVVEEVKKFFRDRVYRTIIPRTVRLSEAPSHGKPIVTYDGRSRGAEVYRELAREVMERGQKGIG